MPRRNHMGRFQMRAARLPSRPRGVQEPILRELHETYDAYNRTEDDEPHAVYAVVWLLKDMVHDAQEHFNQYGHYQGTWSYDDIKITGAYFLQLKHAMAIRPRALYWRTEFARFRAL